MHCAGGSGEAVNSEGPVTSRHTSLNSRASPEAQYLPTAGGSPGNSHSQPAPPAAAHSQRYGQFQSGGGGGGGGQFQSGGGGGGGFAPAPDQVQYNSCPEQVPYNSGLEQVPYKSGPDRVPYNSGLEQVPYNSGPEQHRAPLSAAPLPPVIELPQPAPTASANGISLSRMASLDIPLPDLGLLPTSSASWLEQPSLQPYEQRVGDPAAAPPAHQDLAFTGAGLQVRVYNP